MRWIVLAALLGGCAPTGHLVVSRPAPQPYCTRTLGVAECFADPGALPDRPAELADTPLREHLVCDGFWKNGGAVCQVGQAFNRP